MNRLSTELIFWSIYLANLPENIAWFFTHAPLGKWHMFLISVHRMTWNQTLLSFNHP